MPLGAFRINSLGKSLAAPAAAPSRLPKTINLYGNANYNATAPKIGAGSLRLDGSGDYIDISYSEDIGKWNAATGYTLEYWVKLSSLSGTSYPDGATHELPTAYGNHSATNNVNYWSFGPVDNGNVVFFYYNGGKVTTQTSGVTLSTNTWYHLAFVYDGSSGFKIYIDGTERASGTVSGSPAFSASYPITLGAAGSTTQYMNAYIDELRVSTTARYTTSFTPSTTAFENDADTVLLIHADTDVTDDGNFTMQATGGDMSIETIDGTDYVLHTFTSSSTFTPLASMNIDALLVGGGGGAGFYNNSGAGGGGGGGAVSTYTSQAVTAQGYTITIGAGGADNGYYQGNNGSSTTAFGYTAGGGGGSGAHQYAGKNAYNGGNGGGAGSTYGSTKTGGSGTYNGGNNTGTYYTDTAAGGGGAGANGSNNSSTVAGNGGIGADVSTLFGTTVGVGGYFGGGGGGGAKSGRTPGTGGTGGGANGGQGTAVRNGAANTGGGAGGSGGANDGNAGGSGIVIIRYPVA